MFALNWLGWLVVAVYAVLFTLIVLCFCCDTSEGWLLHATDFCMDTVPSGISWLLRCVCGQWVHDVVVNTTTRTFHWALYERNPILQIFYLAVILGAYCGIVVYAYPKIPCLLLPAWHKYMGVLGVAVCLYLWYLACTVSPGFITDESLHRFRNYPYLNPLFNPGRTCHTTGLPKLPRSKYCRYMKANVARFDHFCPWLNQAVGQENYRFFLLFLAGHVVLLSYGATCMALILYSEVVENDLFNARFINHKDGSVAGGWTIVLRYILARNWIIFGLFVLCGVMAVVLFAFLSYHLYLTGANMTTNETYKWSDIRRYYRHLRKHGAMPVAETHKLGEGQGEVAASSGGEASVGGEPQPPPIPASVPPNLYNRGIVHNFWEVLNPPSLRRHPPTFGEDGQELPAARSESEAHGKSKGDAKKKKKSASSNTRRQGKHGRHQTKSSKAD